MVDLSAPVEDHIYLDEFRSGLRTSLDGLKPNEALVLQLYYVEELNVFEIRLWKYPQVVYRN